MTIGVLHLPFGRLADIAGIKRVFVLGLIVFGLASAITIFTHSILLLIVCQVIRGVDGGDYAVAGSNYQYGYHHDCH
jgi:MFS family permease